MLPVEEFSCQSSMEHTCGQYCSSQSMGGTKAWGRWNSLWLEVDTLGLLTPSSIEEGRAQLAPGWCDTSFAKSAIRSFVPRTRVFDTKRLNEILRLFLKPCRLAALPLLISGEKSEKRPISFGRKLPYTAELMLLPTVVQDHAEQATMNCQPAAVAVIDKAQLPELVHEMTDPRPGGADHLGQVILTDSGNDRF